jgi:hypothetical protein
MDARLASLDPSRREAPPAPGSARYASILERAMSGTDTDTATPAPLTDRPRPRHRRRPYLGAAVAAALVAVVAAVALLGRAGDDPDPISVVASAADSTAEVTSLRATLARETEHSLTSGTFEVTGDRVRIQLSGTYDDGHVEGNTTIIIGRDTWEERLDGGTETYTLDTPIEPFGSSSQAVVAAALSAEDVTVVGHETLRGVPTTHYRITLDEAARSALAGLGEEALGWFGLDSPEGIRTVDVWVGGDLIRRMQVQGEGDTSTTDYYDFGADIVIERPAWAASR